MAGIENLLGADLSNSLWVKVPINQLNWQNYVKSGSIVQFTYSFWKNDPYPLVIVSDTGRYVRGVNLKYLTFPYIKTLLNKIYIGVGHQFANVNNPLPFSYQNQVKGDKYITEAFRQYKLNGIQRLRMINPAALLAILASVRSFDPQEIENITRDIREQMQRVANQSAADMTGEGR